MSLYGIESEDDCRKKIDELLQLTRTAQQQMNKEAISALKIRLKHYYDMGNSNKGEAQMSAVESAYFWHAVSEAYAWGAPNLNAPNTWREKLEEVEYKLKKWRPDA